MALGNLIKSWENIMRDDDGVNGTVQVLSQLVWMLFLKVYDLKEDMWELYEDDFESAIPENCRWRNWAKGKSQKDQMTGEDMVEFINDTLFPTLKGLTVTATSSKRRTIVKEMMAESYNYMKDGVCIRKAVNLLDDIDFDNQEEHHSFNVIYETLLRGLQSAGRSGEFYTPRALTQLITEKVNPRLGEVVADFACGTGGFLIDAVEHLRKQSTKAEDAATIEQTVFGVEKKQFPYMLCTTNMLLHDVDYPRVSHANSLMKNVRDYKPEEKVDVVLMNPPYGGHEQDSIQTNFPAALRSSETANLFMIEILYRLNKDGRCGVILPDGFLQNDDASLIAIKEKLFKECNVHTIIRLPGSCFAPYTNINTNLVFFEKTGATTETWFYRFDLIKGQKFSMKRNPITLEKLSAIIDWWDNRTEIKDEKEDNSLTETWKSRCVSIETIVDGKYNLDFCGFPNEEKVILSPEDTLSIYIEQREYLEKRLAEATSLLSEYLNGNTNVHLQSIGKLTAALTTLNLQFPSDMRSAILQAAMQGKLTEQLDSDTPIDKLTESIEIERTALLSDGFYKPNKKLRPLSDDEIPFDVPENWRWTKLGYCSTYGQTKRKATAEEIKSDIWSLDLEDIEKNTGRILCRQKASQRDIDGDKVRFFAGNILYSKLRPYLLKILIADDDGICTPELIPFDMIGDINPRYIMWVLRSPHVDYAINAVTYGVKMPRVGTETMVNLLIPLPPIEEQQRIVEQLDALLPLCDTLVE